MGDAAPAPLKSHPRKVAEPQRSGEGSWDTQAQPGGCRRGRERRGPISARFKGSGEANRLIFREPEKQILRSKKTGKGSKARKYVALYPQGESFHIENRTSRG